jgi:hypothetical protein
MPEIAMDAMGRGMFGLRKDFLDKDLQTRYPRMAKRGQIRGILWWVKVWRSARSNVVGKFSPRGKKLARNLLALERGATLRPTSKGAMAIPGPGAKNASGKVRKGFRSPATLARTIKGWSTPRQGNRMFLVAKTRAGAGRIMFALHRQVRIPARLGLLTYWKKGATQRAFFERLEKVLKRDLGKAWRGK